VSTDPVLSVRGLTIEVEGEKGRAPRTVVEDISFEVAEGTVIGLVGESGSGKTLTALSLMRLLPPRAGVISGEIRLEGRDVCSLSEREMQSVRGRRMAMIFQEPATALSPMHDVGWHLRAVLLASGQLSGSLRERRRAARARTRELLARVELPEPDALLEANPHQLSAGMRRRVMIAMALAGQPRLLIADEPTTGLDAPIQAQLLDLLARLSREERMSTLVISHDPEVMAELASDVLVMYAGQIVESGPVRRVFGETQHPYTLSLLEAIRARRMPRALAPGGATSDSPRASARAEGCRFARRCPKRQSAPLDFLRCDTDAPALGPALAQHRCRCFYPLLSGPGAND
jgi:oligopeptide/dipeptide ABC transporter ATP-binding protein